MPVATTALRRETLDDQHLASARSVLDEELPGAALAFVSGSLAAGLGHAYSDIDVYVSDDRLTEPLVRRRDGSSVQLTPMSPGTLDATLRTCRGFVATARDRWQVEQTEDELRVALRLAIGTVLVDAGGVVPDVATRRTALRQVLLCRYAGLVSSLAEDVAGALAFGDVRTAQRCSSVALDHAVEALLTATDDLYLGRKFLYRRLERSDVLAPVLPELWRLLREPDLDAPAQEVRELSILRTRVAAHALAVAQRDGWEQPLRGPVRLWSPAGEDGPWPSPWVVAVRYQDAWGLVAPDDGFRVSPGVVSIWSSLRGTDAATLRDDLLRVDPAFADVAPLDLDRTVGELLEIGAAVRPGPDVRPTEAGGDDDGAGDP